mgnify:CR=1 FL=1
MTAEMKRVDVSIKTLKIEIRTLVLDGKRFTKSVFLQLPTIKALQAIRSGDDIVIEIKPELSYLGYVYVPNNPNGHCYWLIFSKNGLIYKCSADLNENSTGFLTTLFYRANPGINANLKHEHQHELNSFYINMGSQIDEIENELLSEENQLYISI